jgi:branched-chain amino acid transport system substrate-binding protein
MFKRKSPFIKSFLATSLIISLVGTFIGCSNNNKTTSKGEILIGVSTGLTGSFAQDGEKVKQGVNMAQEEINKAGGILGKNVKFIFEDDQNNPTVVVNAVNKLASENIVALIGPTLSSTTMAVEQLIKKNNLPTLTGGTSPKLADLGNPYLFRIRASDKTAAKAAAKFAVEKLNGKKIGMVYNNDEFGTGGRDVISEYLKGINIPFYSEGHNEGDKDMAGQLVKLKNRGVDTIICWTHDASLAIIARQIKELNINVNVIGNAALGTPQTLALMDKAWVEGYYTISDIIPADTNPVVQDFVKKFKAKYNVEPELYASANYSAAMVLADAIKRANSTDSDKIREALMNIKDLKEPEGICTANDKGELIHEVVIGKISNMKLQMIAHVTE